MPEGPLGQQAHASTYRVESTLIPARTTMQKSRPWEPERRVDRLGWDAQTLQHSILQSCRRRGGDTGQDQWSRRTRRRCALRGQWGSPWVTGPAPATTPTVQPEAGDVRSFEEIAGGRHHRYRTSCTAWGDSAGRPRPCPKGRPLAPLRFTRERGAAGGA